MKNATTTTTEKNRTLALILSKTKDTKGLEALHEMATFCLMNFTAFCEAFPADKEASEMNTWIEGACFFNARNK